MTHCQSHSGTILIVTNMLCWSLNYFFCPATGMWTQICCAQEEYSLLTCVFLEDRRESFGAYDFLQAYFNTEGWREKLKEFKDLWLTGSETQGMERILKCPVPRKQLYGETKSLQVGIEGNLKGNFYDLVSWNRTGKLQVFKSPGMELWEAALILVRL